MVFGEFNHQLISDVVAIVLVNLVYRGLGLVLLSVVAKSYRSGHHSLFFFSGWF